MGWIDALEQDLEVAKNGLKALLEMAGMFEVGEIWWCEDCERRGVFKGGFVDVIPRRHYRGCAMNRA